MICLTDMARISLVERSEKDVPSIIDEMGFVMSILAASAARREMWYYSSSSSSSSRGSRENVSYGSDDEVVVMRR